jgi:hypothetical protein
MFRTPPLVIEEEKDARLHGSYIILSFAMTERGLSSSSKKNPKTARKSCYHVIETSAI